MSAPQLVSSPLSSIEPSQENDQSSNQASGPYRMAQQLPFELAQHVQTYFEESLFSQAFNLLYSVASSSVSSNTVTPVKIPPPEFLAVTATLAVHPTLTTRTKSKDKLEQANAALRLLRLVLRAAGPVNARFTQSFVFRKYDFRSPRWPEPRTGEGEDCMQKLSISYADSDSLFTLAEDFWTIVGWSLNCSCLRGMYASRWERWSLWLEFMLEAVEEDWKLRAQINETHESLAWRYINNSASSNPRRILRAIFADGGVSALNEFREIFHKELKEPKSDQQKLKKREVKVNVEEEIYGDYMATDDSSESSDHDNDHVNSNGLLRPRPSKRVRTRTPSTRRSVPQLNQTETSPAKHSDVETGPNTSSSLGSPQSLSIRLRLMTVLVNISSDPALMNGAKTKNMFPDLHDLFTLFVEFIKPLPLPTFQQLISPSAFSEEIFPCKTQVTLCVFLLERLLESSAPTIHNPASRMITQKILVEDYLPFAAAKATIDAQCRTSLVLETLVRRLAITGHLRKTAELLSAIGSGVEKRLAKVTDTSDVKARRKAGRGGVDEEDEAWNILVESGERMKMVADGLKPVSVVSVDTSGDDE